jgi:hypothetical protein
MMYFLPLLETTGNLPVLSVYIWPASHAALKKGHVDVFGGVVTQRKTQSPPASPARKVNAETWANMCD